METKKTKCIGHLWQGHATLQDILPLNNISMHLKDGYKQVEIAKYLCLSKSHVSKVLKEVEI